MFLVGKQKYENGKQTVVSHITIVCFAKPQILSYLSFYVDFKFDILYIYTLPSVTSSLLVCTFAMTMKSRVFKFGCKCDIYGRKNN